MRFKWPQYKLVSYLSVYLHLRGLFKHTKQLLLFSMYRGLLIKYVGFQGSSKPGLGFSVFPLNRCSRSWIHRKPSVVNTVANVKVITSCATGGGGVSPVICHIAWMQSRHSPGL